MLIFLFSVVLHYLEIICLAMPAKFRKNCYGKSFGSRPSSQSLFCEDRSFLPLFTRKRVQTGLHLVQNTHDLCIYRLKIVVNDRFGPLLIIQKANCQTAQRFYRKNRRRLTDPDRSSAVLRDLFPDAFYQLDDDGNDQLRQKR